MTLGRLAITLAAGAAVGTGGVVTYNVLTADPPSITWDTSTCPAGDYTLIASATPDPPLVGNTVMALPVSFTAPVAGNEVTSSWPAVLPSGSYHVIGWTGRAGGGGFSTQGQTLVTGPPPPPEEICGNGIDDDLDGTIDENPPCVPPPPPAEVCGNGVDDDLDGLIDENPPCVPPPPQGPFPTITTTVSNCKFVLASNAPDTRTGWRAQFKRDGVNVGTIDATPPFTRTVTLKLGIYQFNVLWSRLDTTDTLNAPSTIGQCPPEKPR